MELARRMKSLIPRWCLLVSLPDCHCNRIRHVGSRETVSEACSNAKLSNMQRMLCLGDQSLGLWHHPGDSTASQKRKLKHSFYNTSISQPNARHLGCNLAHS